MSRSLASRRLPSLPVTNLREQRLGRFGLPSDRALRWILLAGALLRLLLFKPLYPVNNDDHFGVIRFFLEHGVLPAADLTSQGYHPPLYYLLASPLAALAGLRGAELVSLALSLFNLWLLARLVATTELIATDTARRHVLAFAALLPQFVVFGLFVSNDALSYPVGTLFILVAFAYVERPTTRMLLALGAMTGVGLLTKGTFLAFVPVTAALVLAVAWRRHVPLRRAVALAAVCLVVAMTVGSYKFVENQRRFGRPIVHMLDFPATSMSGQKGTIKGVRSFVSFDLPKLVADPFDRRVARHSVPLLLYATTWYSYIRESNLRLVRRSGFGLLAPLLCVVGLVPTALGLIGLGRVLGGMGELTLVPTLPEERYVALGKRVTAVALFLATLGIVVTAGVRYDVVSCFQGRLIFPVLFAGLLLMAGGFDGVVAWRPGSRRWLNAALLTAYIAWGWYYVVAIASTV
jgi:4-amino-4-deoxy-L-arabinose transferase-like glycosyltransferase